MTKEELYLQSLTDLSHINSVLIEILKTKQITQEDDQKFRYCKKLSDNVTETQKKINALP